MRVALSLTSSPPSRCRIIFAKALYLRVHYMCESIIFATAPIEEGNSHQAAHSHLGVLYLEQAPRSRRPTTVGRPFARAGPGAMYLEQVPGVLGPHLGPAADKEG